MRWMDLIIALYNDDEFMRRLELIFSAYFSGVFLISMDVLIKMFPDMTYPAVKHLLYFSPLVGSDTVKALIAYTPL